jgi:uncharacterized protein with GYD domain
MPTAGTHCIIIDLRVAGALRPRNFTPTLLYTAFPEERDIMKRRTAFAVASLSVLLPGLALISGDAVGQQSPPLHRYFVRAVLTTEGVKNLQKQPATALRAGVAKFAEAAGGKIEFWYFDYTESTAYSIIDYPDEISAATTQLVSNAAGFARVTVRSVLSAEDVDKALAKANSIRPPQQQ